MIKDRIWSMLVDLKFKGYCLAFLVDKFQKWDRNINIFLAVSSSGSIAAWAIWNAYPIIWGAIIAFSQVLTVVKPYIPYFKYVKELNTKCLKMEIINLELERLWYHLQHDRISSELSEDQYFDIRKQTTEIFNFGDDMIFEVDSTIERKANERMKTFLKNTYGLSITLN